MGQPPGAPSGTLEALEALYAALPGIDCRRHCYPSCGPIVVGALEWERIAAAAGERSAADDLVCPYLERETGLCGVYPLRPLICRLWGVVETLPCAWGCEPERVLTRDEADALIEQVMALSGGEARTVWAGWEAMLRAAGASGAGAV